MLNRATTKPEWRSPRLGWRFAFACFLYHFFIAIAIRSAEAPDEWWQSAEVAYYLVFHKGTPTWEWRQGIRSVFFPSLFAIGFKLLQILHLDSPRALYLSERLTQAAILTGIHVTLCHLARRLEDSLNEEVGAPEQPRTKAGSSRPRLLRLSSAFLTPSLVTTVARLGCVQWYFVYAGVRAYSNVTEALFFSLALVPQNLPWFLVWAGLACVTRVTAAISLMPVFFHHWRRLVRQRGVVVGTALTFLCTLAMVCVVCAGVVAVDYLFYQRVVFTPYAFIKSNIGDDVSRFFGEHPFYWYAALALPFMVGLHYFLAFAAPVVLKRIRAGPRTREQVNLYLSCLIWTLLVHSFVAHKEMRFLYSQVVIAMLLGAFVAVCGTRYPSRVFGKRKMETVLSIAHLVAMVINVVLLTFVGLFVREGCLDMMAVVRNGPHHYRSLDVVTLCYFLPGYSQVHGKVDELHIVDCPVVLDSEGTREPTPDWLLRQDSVRFLWWKYARQVMPPTPEDDQDTVAAWYETAQRVLPREGGPSPLPDGIILFQELADQVEASFLTPRGYELVKRVHHLTFIGDEDSHIDLWRRVNASE